MARTKGEKVTNEEEPATPSAVIENCEERFRFRCPKVWDELARTSDPRIRRCGACDKQVHYCDDAAGLDRLAKEGKCVALRVHDEGGWPDFIVGGLIEIE